MNHRARGGYQSAMVGGGRRHVLGQAMAEIEQAADEGDPRAMAMCDAMRSCGTPGWRARQIAPGIQAPCDDLYPLSFESTDGSPTFVGGGVATKIFVAKPQKPFRGERPIAILQRIGATAVNQMVIMQGGLLVGTDPQTAQVSDQNVEFFTQNAFGIRMVMKQADPGVELRVRLTLRGPVLVAPDTVTVDFTVFGSIWA